MDGSLFFRSANQSLRNIFLHGIFLSIGSTNIIADLMRRINGKEEEDEDEEDEENEKETQKPE